MVRRSENILPAISCPACDFERNNGGSPLQITKYHYICAVCSTKWKELGVAENNIIGLVENNSAGPDVARQKIDNNDKINWANDGKFFVAAVLTIFAVLVGASFLFVSRPANITEPSIGAKVNQLVIQDVEIRPAHSAPKSAWIITARVENPSLNSMHVPDIHVRIGRPGNRGYIDHYYKPALQKLQPGANFRLRVAIRKTHVRKSQISLAFSNQ